MLNDSQLLKGVLEVCVLKIISRKETYGYEIIMTLNEYGFNEIVEGTLYPILIRLEKKQCIQARKEKSPFGPIRKYYSITSLGEEYIKEYTILWDEIIQKTNKILLDDTTL